MKKRLLPITAVCLLGMLFGVASCGETPSETPSETPNTSEVTPTTSETPSETPTTSEDTGIVLNKLEIKNKAIFDATAEGYEKFYQGSEGRTIELEMDPVQNIPLLIKNKQLKVESSNPEVANVSGLKVLPVAPGEATITVTVGNKSDSIKVTVEKAVPIAEKTVTFEEMVDIVKNTHEEDNKTLYTVSGFAVDVKGDKYGNFYLAGEVNGKVQKIQVYGCSVENPFEYTEVAGIKIGVHFNNKKDFITGGNPFHEGEYVTIKCMASAYKGNGQLLSQFVEKPAAPESAHGKKVTLTNVAEKGTVTFVKSEGLTMGEEVSFKVEAKEGYFVKAVLVNGAGVKADAEGNYKFYCGFDNKVEVVYGREGYVSTAITAAALGVTTTEKDVTQDIADKEINGVTWAGAKLGLYYKDKSSLCLNPAGYVENTTATAMPISELVLNYSDYSHDNKDQLKVEFFTEYGGAAAETVMVSTVAGTSRYVVKPSAEKYNFVKISYNMDKYSAKLANFEIETKEGKPEEPLKEVAMVAEYDLGGISGSWPNVFLYDDITAKFQNKVVNPEVALASVTAGTKYEDKGQTKSGVEMAQLGQGPKVGGIKLNGKYANNLTFKMTEGQSVDRVVLKVRTWNTEAAALTLNGGEPVEIAGNATDIQTVTFDKRDMSEFTLSAVVAADGTKSRPVIVGIEFYNEGAKAPEIAKEVLDITQKFTVNGGEWTVKNNGTIDYHDSIAIRFQGTNEDKSLRFSNFTVDGQKVTAKEVKDGEKFLGYDVAIASKVGSTVVVKADIAQLDYDAYKTWQVKTTTENCTSATNDVVFNEPSFDLTSEFTENNGKIVLTNKGEEARLDLNLHFGETNKDKSATFANIKVNGVAYEGTGENPNNKPDAFLGYLLDVTLAKDATVEITFDIKTTVAKQYDLRITGPMNPQTWGASFTVTTPNDVIGEIVPTKITFGGTGKSGDLTDAKLNAAIKLPEGSTLVAPTASELTKVYGYNDTEVKLGSGSAAGSFKLTFAETAKIVKVEVEFAVWNEGEGPLVINGVDFGSTTGKADYQTVAKEIEQTNVLAIGTTAKRAMIRSITVYVG